MNYFNLFGRSLAGVRPGGGRVPHAGRATSASSTSGTRRATAVPLSALVTMRTSYGPEFTMRFNVYRAAQINGDARARATARGRPWRRSRRSSRETMPREMGFDYVGMSFQEKLAAQGIPASAIFGLSLLVVFLILAAQYESWSLPFSVLLRTPIAVFGAFAALWLRAPREQRVRADRPGHAHRPRRQERHPHRRVRQGRVRARRVAQSRPRSPARACACAPSS